MANRKLLMWLLLAVLIVVPLTGVFVIGTVELLLWAVLLAVWVVVFRRWASRTPADTSNATS